jgi:small multidrug resistance family-3 protein
MKNMLSQLVSTPLGAFAVLALAALLEVSGDACFQSGLYRSSGAERAGWFVTGVLVLAGYGLFVNLPQWDFGKLLGVYVVLFFVVAQVVAKVRFHQSPTLPIYAGGALIVAGGVVMTFWKA